MHGKAAARGLGEEGEHGESEGLLAWGAPAAEVPTTSASPLLHAAALVVAGEVEGGLLRWSGRHFSVYASKVSAKPVLASGERNGNKWRWHLLEGQDGAGACMGRDSACHKHGRAPFASTSSL